MATATAKRRSSYAIVALTLRLTTIGTGGATASEDSMAMLHAAMSEAEAALQQNEIQLAESRYRSALLEGWMLIGTLDTLDDDLEAAKRAFKLATAAAVNTRRARTSLALVHLRRGETGEAIATLRQVLARFPQDRTARKAVAQALIAEGRVEEAVQELEEAHVAMPNDSELTFSLGAGYLRLGNVERAEALFAQVAKERPLPQTQVLIGRTYRDFEQFDRARAAFQKALELDPQVRRARYYLGTTELLAIGRDGLETSIDYFEAELGLTPDDPSANFYLGTALAERRDFEQALKVLEIAKRWPPTQINALRFMGRCLLGLNRVPEAIEKLEETIELATASGTRYRTLSMIHYQLGVALRRDGRRTEAEEHFATAKEYSARDVETERQRFSYFLRETLNREENPEAFAAPIGAAPIRDLRQEARGRLRSQVAKLLARAYMNLGVMATRAARFDRAAGHFARTGELDPEFPRLHASLGTALFNAERFDEAIDSLRLAVESAPEDDGLRRMLALAWLNTDAYESAAELLAADPERQANPSLQYAYALALVRSGRGAEAQQEFDELLQQNREWPELHVLLGQAHAQEDDYEAAVESLHRAIALKPDVAEAHATLGNLYLRQGKLEDAERELRAELSLNPRDVRTRYHLATVLELSRRPDEALPYLQSLLREVPDFADARYLLGKILLARGDAEEAVAHLESAAAAAPDDFNIHYQLGQAYQRSGRPEEARREFEIYRQLKNRPEEDPS